MFLPHHRYIQINIVDKTARHLVVTAFQIKGNRTVYSTACIPNNKPTQISPSMAFCGGNPPQESTTGDCWIHHTKLSNVEIFPCHDVTMKLSHCFTGPGCFIIHSNRQWILITARPHNSSRWLSHAPFMVRVAANGGNRKTNTSQHATTMPQWIWF